MKKCFHESITTFQEKKCKKVSTQYLHFFSWFFFIFSRKMFWFSQNSMSFRETYLVIVIQKYVTILLWYIESYTFWERQFLLTTISKNWITSEYTDLNFTPYRISLSESYTLHIISRKCTFWEQILFWNSLTAFNSYIFPVTQPPNSYWSNHNFSDIHC